MPVTMRFPITYVLHVLGELRMKYRNSDGPNPWVSILYVSRETCTCCGPKADQEVMQTICENCAESWAIDHKIRTNNRLMLTSDDVKAILARSRQLAARVQRNPAAPVAVSVAEGADTIEIVWCEHPDHLRAAHVISTECIHPHFVPPSLRDKMIADAARPDQLDGTDVPAQRDGTETFDRCNLHRAMGSTGHCTSFNCTERGWDGVTDEAA